MGEEESDFWNFLDPDKGYNIDLSKVFSKTDPMTSQILGYVGTDTQPPCTDKFCWYLKIPTMTITQETLDLLKDPAATEAGTTWNNREVDLGVAPIAEYLFTGRFYSSEL